MNIPLPFLKRVARPVALLTAAAIPSLEIAAEIASPEIGIAVRDISPELPIRLAGYAARTRPVDKADPPLVAQAVALKNRSGERFVFVALDNCEVSRAFVQPVLQALAGQFQLGRGAVAVVSRHTHSGPVLDETLTGMAYARPQLEALQPGAIAVYLPGIGADSDPAQRGRWLAARRHGLELAGAIVGVLDRPVRPVRGAFKLTYEDIDLPLPPPPGREQLETDAQSADVHVKLRAKANLKRLNAGQPLPASLQLPLATLRLGDDLTFVMMGGEVVVDYTHRLKRRLAGDHPWPVGYAYEVPCYIPSARLLKEGGYEAESSILG